MNRFWLSLTLSILLYGTCNAQYSEIFNMAAHDSGALARDAHLASATRTAEHAHSTGFSARAAETSLSNGTEHSAHPLAPHTADTSALTRDTNVSRPTSKDLHQTRNQPSRESASLQKSNPTREAWKEQAGEARAQKRVESYTGHGNARHGSQTTLGDQRVRIETGIAPDGRKAPTTRATRFDSSKLQVEAVERAKNSVRTAPEVAESETRDIVVGGGKQGYGSGFEKRGGVIRSSGQDQNALVRFQWNKATNTWEPITQFPTNRTVTK